MVFRGLANMGWACARRGLFVFSFSFSNTGIMGIAELNEGIFFFMGEEGNRFNIPIERKRRPNKPRSLEKWEADFPEFFFSCHFFFSSFLSPICIYIYPQKKFKPKGMHRREREYTHMKRIFFFKYHHHHTSLTHKYAWNFTRANTTLS